MEGIKGIWSLQQAAAKRPSSSGSGESDNAEDSGVFDKYLVQAYAWETRVLWIDEDDEMCECEIPGFSTQVTTIYCGNMVWQPAKGAETDMDTGKGKGQGEEESFFVQVTPEGARLICAVSGELLHHHEVAGEKKVMVAEGNCSQVRGVCVVCGGVKG